MPTYDYQCEACKASYELRQGFDAATSHSCEACGTGVAKRVLHAPRVVFKGSGWYVTDSRKSTTAVSDATADGGDKTAGSDTATTDTNAPAGKDAGSTESTGVTGAAAG